jgi:hypothetical protein
MGQETYGSLTATTKTLPASFKPLWFWSGGQWRGGGFGEEEEEG